MSIVKQVEDDLITKIKAVLGSTVRTVEWAPPDWDEEFVKRTLLALPGVFVIFEGGSRDPGTEHSVVLSTQWTIAAVTHHVQAAKQRARGDALEIGCYDILELLASALNGYRPASLGTLELNAWINAEALKMDRQALMMQELSYSLSIELPTTVTTGDLAPFETFHDSFDVGQSPGAPTTEDFVELPQ